METIMINGKKYVQADTINCEPIQKEGLTYCIVRTYSAGVWMGWTDYDNAPLTNCEVLQATRIWKWDGAFTLSNLAQEGTTEPKNCRFAVDVTRVKLNNVIEFLPVTSTAKTILDSVQREKNNV